MSMRFGFLAFLALFVLFLNVVTITAVDDHESCEMWAQSGECTTNPGYMEKSCPDACAKYGNTEEQRKPVDVPGSLYEITETDLGGNSISLEKMKGKVLYIVNVASYCGYTAENYAIFKKLKQYRTEGFEIILAPCNQFGFQEPGDGTAIAEFADKKSFDGVILSKSDVNGPDTRPLFAYLKAATGKAHIDWNFDGKFLVSRTGKVELVRPGWDVETEVLRLLRGDEL